MILLLAAFILPGWLFTGGLAQIGLCPAPNGDFPNPSSELCTTFFRCYQGNPSLLRCSANQRFDFLFKMCRQQRLVNCQRQLEVFAAPPPLSGIGAIGQQLAPLVGNDGLGGFGGLNGGLINLLSQLGGRDEGETNGDTGLANLLMMSTMLNQRNTAGQESTLPGPVPLSQFYPIYSQTPLTSLVEHQGQATSQNYRQAGDIYPSNENGLAEDVEAGLANGKTFIFVPQQYAPVQGQIDQAQGQGYLESSRRQNNFSPQGQNLGLGQHINQGHSSMQGQNSDFQQDRRFVQGQNWSKLKNYPQNKLVGSFQGQNSDTGQILSQGRNYFQNRNIGVTQDKNHGQNDIQGQLSDLSQIANSSNITPQGRTAFHHLNQSQNDPQGQNVLQGQNGFGGQKALGEDNKDLIQGPNQSQLGINDQWQPQSQNGYPDQNRFRGQGRRGLRGRGHRRNFRFQVPNLLTQSFDGDDDSNSTSSNLISLADFINS